MDIQNVCPRCNHAVAIGININAEPDEWYVAYCGNMNGCETYRDGCIGTGKTRDIALSEFLAQAAAEAPLDQGRLLE